MMLYGLKQVIISMLVCTLLCGGWMGVSGVNANRVALESDLTSVGVDGILLSEAPPGASIQHMRDAGVPLGEEPIRVMEGGGMISPTYMMDGEKAYIDLGGATFTYAEFQFVNDKLINIYMLFDGAKKIEKIRTNIVALYGEPEESSVFDGKARQSIWDIDIGGKTVRMAQIVQYSKDEIKHASFQITYDYVLDEENYDVAEETAS